MQLLIVSALAAAASASTHAVPVRPALGSHAAALRLRGGGSFGKALHGASVELFAANPKKGKHGTKAAEPRKPRLEDHVRGVVFGGMDGILTTFALLAAVAGAAALQPTHARSRPTPEPATP
jgi:hypothetical protein